MDAGGMLPPGVNAPNTAAPAEGLPVKKQAVVDRLRRRIDNYRRRQSDFMPRFGQSFNGFCEQNIQETLLLKQKYLENKNKRAAKKQEKKQPDPVGNLIAQQKFLKRPADEDGDFGDTGSAKLPCGVTGANQSGNSISGNAGGGLTKFSVEIVQQLEFTTSAANSQPQQISTNVTVKALTNASVKSDVESPKPAAPSPAAPLIECKQEPDSEFVDLEQCAAALEKDAQNNSSFPGFSELIGHESSDDIITSDAFKDLISEISDFHPEFMKEFDFPENHNVCKIEIDSKEGIVPQQQNFTQYESNAVKHNVRMPNAYSGLEFGKAELSPAAQTLKQMAEQHQHKAQMGIGFPPSRRSPYSEYQFQASQNQSASAEVKQEVMFSVSQSQNLQAGVRSPSGAKTPTLGGYKQQYSPYSSPGASSSPNYMPRGQGPGQMPPRPTSVPTGASLSMNQAQQMHINQQSPSPQIQVSAGQHMQLNSDLKAGVSIAAQQQQGMYFTPSSADNSYTVSQSQTINFTQQSLRQRPVLRPPPPDYKTAQQQPPMHSMPQQRFQQQQGPVRRPGPGQQPMPPSGPMMRPQMTAGGGMYLGGGGMPRTMAPGPPPGATGYLPRQRPPNISVGPDGLSLGSVQGRGDRTEWRHVVLSQQQSAAFSPHMRPFASHPGTYQVQNSGGGMPQMHQQPMRTQMQMMPQMMHVPVSNSHQMSMNLQMSQSQSMSVGGVINTNPNNSNSLQYHHMHHGNASNTLATGSSDGGGGVSHHLSNGLNSNSGLGADLTLEFLEGFPNDAHDLFGNLDSPSSNFNLNDIL